MKKTTYVVENDMFDIANRLKKIDDKYFIVRNFVKHRYEVHYKRNFNSLELVVPYDILDERTIYLVLKTRMENRHKILEEMEKENKKLEMEKIKKQKEKIMERFEECR